MKRGFSLIEILVAVSIIALLSATSLSGYRKTQARSRDAKRIADVGALGVGIESYRNITGAFPEDGTTNSDGREVNLNLKVLVDTGLINTLPSDPRSLTGDSNPFCNNYTYKKNWNSSANSLYTAWRSTYNENLGPRAYAVYFATETAASTDLKHPLNKDIPATSTLSWCGNSRGYGYLLGPRI